MVQGLEDKEILDRVLKDNLLQKRSPVSGRRQAMLILNRVRQLPEPFWTTVRGGSHEQATQVLLCAAIKYSPILGDFITRVISEHVRTFKKTLSHRDWDTFYEESLDIDPTIDSWSDATIRFQEFIATAWPKEHLEENLKFIADSLDPRQGETPIQTIRRFISTSFFKDYHLRVYKKRPIYWLFSSGKKRAFQCLVYLHRYSEATLSRMRGMYVTPLMGKYKARLEFLEHEFDNAGTNTVRNKVKKEIQIIRDKLDELRSFDELLRHYADQRITLDLDDGVKVNYGKFGDLLAEVKAVTGLKAED